MINTLIRKIIILFMTNIYFNSISTKIKEKIAPETYSEYIFSL